MEPTMETKEPETTSVESVEQPSAPQKKREGIKASEIAHTLHKLGLGFFAPFVLLAVGDEPQKQVREIILNITLPCIAIIAFMVLWSMAAQSIRTESVGIPSPGETWSAWVGIVEFAEREAQKGREFSGRMEKLAAKQEDKIKKYEEQLVTATGEDAAKLEKRIASTQNRIADLRSRKYVGPPTFFDQIVTSLYTVAVGFFAATLVAIPIGVLCGLSKYFNVAVNPLIQIFKPVSPLAWLPIVFVFVTVLYEPAESEKIFTRAMFISAFTVTLCSLWPTLINTAAGVASIDPDFMNVAKVLKLNFYQRITKIILPATLPQIFTGLRISLGVGWMVLVAADMLAQNPGIGKFVWDTFQNGSSESMAQIACAIFAVGIIGFLLDRVMLVLQRFVSYDSNAI